jgi:hypothetical protein
MHGKDLHKELLRSARMSPGIQHAASLSLSALLRWKWAGVELSYRGAIQRQSGMDLNSFHFDANPRIAPHGYRERLTTHAAVSVPKLWQALRRRGMEAESEVSAVWG